MAYDINETGTNTHQVVVTVSAEDFMEDYKRALRKLSRRVRIDGFRRGNIPLSVMQRNYGDSVRAEVVDELVNKQINEVIDEAPRPVLFLGQPELKSMPTKQRALQFVFDIEMSPAVDPIGYMGVEVERPVVSVEDAEVDAALEALREEYATLEPIEGRTTIEQGDSVELDFRALSDDPEVQALQGDDVSIVVGSGQALAGIEEALDGAEFGTTITTTVQLDANFPIPELREQDVEIELVIKDVKKRVLPELDDDFAVDTGEAETLLELRGQIRQKLVADQGEEAKQIARDRMLDLLLGDNSFELPPKFLEQQVADEFRRQLQSLQQQGFDPSLLGLGPEEMINKIREDKVNQLKAEFLLRAIADKEDITAEESDLKGYFAEQAESMGVGAFELERYIRADQDRLYQAQMSIVLNKTVDYLYSEAILKDGEWPSDDEDVAAAADEEE